MNAPLQIKDIARIGGFTTSEVGRLLGRNPTEIGSWLRGSRPLIAPDYEPINGRLILSFPALVEARAISYFLGEGVSRAKLREIMHELRQRIGNRHPLAADKKLVTDGFRPFEQVGETLINLANDVYAEPTLMTPALHGHVVFDQGTPLYLQPEPLDLPLVRIDPRHAFGKPVVVDKVRAVTTAALAATAEHEGLEQAAEWYGVTAAAAIQAAEYERRLAACSSSDSMRGYPTALQKRLG